MPPVGERDSEMAAAALTALGHLSVNTGPSDELEDRAQRLGEPKRKASGSVSGRVWVTTPSSSFTP